MKPRRLHSETIVVMKLAALEVEGSGIGILRRAAQHSPGRRGTHALGAPRSAPRRSDSFCGRLVRLEQAQHLVPAALEVGFQPFDRLRDATRAHALEDRAVLLVEQDAALL